MAVPIFAEGMLFTRILFIQTHSRKHARTHTRAEARAINSLFPCGFFWPFCVSVCVVCSFLCLLVCFVVASKTQMSKKKAPKEEMKWTIHYYSLLLMKWLKQKAIYHHSVPMQFCVLHFGYCCISVAFHLCQLSTPSFIFSAEMGKTPNDIFYAATDFFANFFLSGLGRSIVCVDETGFSLCKCLRQTIPRYRSKQYVFV